jgi:glycyl-tRNA synthetase beta chain
MPDVLIELFSEEIPARMQARAREDLRRLVTDGLVEAGLTYAAAGGHSTPRRLVLTIEGLTAQSAAVREERKGPRVDAPVAAVEGFLRSTGLTRDRLVVRAEKGAEVYFAVLEKPGRAAGVILAEVLEGAIRGFPWPKSMRWGTGSLRWVRPLQSILCLMSDEAGAVVVPLTVDGIVAGNTTGGHRFMAPARFAVSGFEDYAAKLRRAFVMLDAGEREAAIWHDATTLAFARGLEVVPDAGLLAEVAGLVEWPVVLMGAIGEGFLGLPAEVLQTSMREHQKFFSVKNPKTGRIEGFVTVANRETADHGATILAGNRKVLSARLSDARFFWENDLRVAKAGMGEWAEGLKAVTFHNKLGSQAERIERIAALAREIAPLVGADAEDAAQAARLAKLDLRSAMVGEFPELQGVMGRYYVMEALSAAAPRPPGQGPDYEGALVDRGPGLAPGREQAIANAARDHWRPKGEGDDVPSEPLSVAVALADKIDTLTGFWAIDEKPTGSKDPFALRRAALGVIRLVVGNGVRMPFREKTNVWLPTVWHLSQIDSRAKAVAAALIASSSDHNLKLSFQSGSRPNEVDKLFLKDAIESLLAFLHDRLKVYLRDQGIRHDIIDACLAMPGNDDLTLLVKRATALAATLKTEDGANLIQGFKRANNILTQAEAKDGVEYSYGADIKFAENDAERALFAALDAAEAVIAPAMVAEHFGAAMTAMAGLRGPIDAFFDAVQVNADSPMVRRNRLNLLHRIRAVCGQVADLTKLEG